MSTFTSGKTIQHNFGTGNDLFARPTLLNSSQKQQKASTFNSMKYINHSVFSKMSTDTKQQSTILILHNY